MNTNHGGDMSATLNDAMLTEAQAAELLGIQPQTLNVWRCQRRYDLRYVRVGRLIRYPLSEVRRFIARRTVGASEPSTA
jgi:hypothetical protein